MTLNDLFYNADVLRAMATIFAVLGSTVGLYVIALWGAAKGADYWRALKGQLPVITELVDEPSDQLNMLSDRLLDRLYEAQWNQMAAIFLPKLIEDMGKMIDAKLESPPQEVAIAVERVADPKSQAEAPHTRTEGTHVT